MQKLYLSPSTQESNPYVTGSGSEEYWMNLLADALEPYLTANTVAYVRNMPDMTAASSIAQANRLGGFDAYLALHSNAAGAGREGQERGVIVFYYPTSVNGQRLAALLSDELKRVYPLPELVRTAPTTTLGEVRRPRFPSVLAELGYHDNADDARWVENNLDAIAQALARGVVGYFGLPFVYPRAAVTGAVATGGAPLRLRAYPGVEGAMLARMPDGSSVTVLGEWEGWYSVRYGDTLGYAAAAYILI